MTPQQTAVFHFAWQDATDETKYQLLEQANPSGSFELVATLPANTTTYDLPVSLVQKINASYQLQACLDNVCVSYKIAAVGGTLASAIGYLKASNAEKGDAFGVVLAMSGDGNTLAVGANNESSNATGINGDQTDNSADNSGAVYVFTRINSVWAQQAYVKPSNTAFDGNFGKSLALSTDGNTLAVGANDASNATGVNGDQTNGSADYSGAAYVFTRTGNTWVQQAYVKASNTNKSDQFGDSVALSYDGNTLAVGATLESSNATGINGDQTNNAAEKSGAVYVFTRTGTVWAQQAYIKASNTEATQFGDWFGYQLVLSADGKTLAVSSAQEDSNATGINGNQANNSARRSGAVYIFTLNGSTWTQQAYVKASNTEAYDDFGGSLSLSADGNTLAVGATGERSDATGVNGDQTNNSRQYSGAVYVFTRTNSIWEQQAYLKSSNKPLQSFFGASVALSADGNMLAVGAYGDEGSGTGVNSDQTQTGIPTGAVYVFKRTASNWVQSNYIKSSNKNGGKFGDSLAISSDGNTLAVGDWMEYSNATGINGNQTDKSAIYSGAVYIY